MNADVISHRRDLRARSLPLKTLAIKVGINITLALEIEVSEGSYILRIT